MSSEEFPPYIHSVVSKSREPGWLVQAQDTNECGCTTPANALNLIFPHLRVQKDQLIKEAGPFFQRGLGGSPSPVSGWLLRRYGAGTHFGNLSRTNKEAVLRDLINRKIPVVIELWDNVVKVGPLTLKLYGKHSVLLVGYSDAYADAQGQQREEYYIVDAEWRPQGRFSIDTNDRDGAQFPGNRTFERAEFLQAYSTGIYFPVFPSQLEHDSWYHTHIRPMRSNALVSWLRDRYLTGTYDEWVG